MSPAALADYLHTHMPVSRAMGVAVVSASVEEVVLEAPLAPNLNMHGTMFGGSIATLALLAAWSVLHLRLESAGIVCQLVVHRSETDFVSPVEGPARAVARLEGADWDAFAHVFERRGKARMAVPAEVISADAVAARFDGTFVAIAER